LGINLMPGAYKVCSFNCLYCHYGSTKQHTLDVHTCLQDLPSLDRVLERIRIAARSALEFDYLTFSGNGEPTLYPQFAELVRDVVRIRDQYRPRARLALLSNSTGLAQRQVQECLHWIDLPVFKLDAGSEEMFGRLNRPAEGVAFAAVLDALASAGEICLQTLLVDGDPSNVRATELEAYFAHVARIRPREVHLYSIDRPVATPGLVRVRPQELQDIARWGEQQSGVEFKAFWAE
jgi:wyosine [tRNA(Phe)-imidazoG37] synthetase (radical SAM superfamily)